MGCWLSVMMVLDVGRLAAVFVIYGCGLDVVLLCDFWINYVGCLCGD